MIATNHILAGALIAASVNQPAVAIPLAFLSHFALDMLPHFAIQVQGDDVRARNNLPLFKRITRVDTTLSIIALLTVPALLSATAAWSVTLVCMLAAVSPDFAWIYRFIKERRTHTLGPKNRFNQFHKSIQWGEFPWALPIDIAWLLGSVALLIGIIE